MILDITAMGRRMGVREMAVETEAPVLQDEGTPCLAVRVGADLSAVIPLTYVRRTFKAKDLDIQRHGESLFVVYEDHAVPVLLLHEDWEALVLCEDASRQAAIGVSSLQEVVTGCWEVTTGVGPAWSLGMTHYDGRVLAMMDIQRLIATGRPHV